MSQTDTPSLRALDERALEALARAMDREEAACMGDPSPWDSADAENDVEWKRERITAARAGMEAYLDALAPAEPAGYIYKRDLDFLRNDGAYREAKIFSYNDRNIPLYTTPVPATDAVRALGELTEAGRKVLAGLDARIDAAPRTAVPVFDGIADLHDALNRAEAALSPATGERDETPVTEMAVRSALLNAYADAGSYAALAEKIGVSDELARQMCRGERAITGKALAFLGYEHAGRVYAKASGERDDELRRERADAVLAGVEAAQKRIAEVGERDAVTEADWRDDPGADERWSAGLDFGMTQLCAVLGVDPQSVSWDAATETLDGDVSSVLGNILRAKFGEDWGSAASLRAPVPEGWRTMDSAPRDGSLIEVMVRSPAQRWNAARFLKYAKDDLTDYLWRPAPTPTREG